jgi:hypothetical protein
MTLKNFRKIGVLFLAVLALAVPERVAGQATALGRILGTVTDPSQSAIPQASVKVTNQETGIARETTTDSQGNFNVPSLVQGVYRVEVTAPAFQRQVQENIRLDIGGSVKADFQLSVGQVTETVQVEATADLLQATEGVISTTVTNANVVELPLNGRNFNNLVRLAPGATRGVNAGGPTLNAQTFAVSGSRSDNANYTLDGMYNNGTFFKTAAIAPSIDAIQEFKIQTNMSAKYGAAAGANINVAIRSGGNEVHGSLFEFLRNNKLDSRDYFASARRHYRRNQFGGAVGGPFYIPKVYDGRNRSFWFFNYEGSRERRGQTQLATLPTPEMIAGDLSRLQGGAAGPPIFNPFTERPNPNGSGFIRDPFPNNQIPANLIKPYSTAYAEFWFPFDQIDRSLSNGNFVNALPLQRDDDQVNVRIDHKFSDANTLFGRVSWVDIFQRAPATMPKAFTGTANKYIGFTINDTHIITPTTILDIRLGYLRANLFQGPTQRFIDVYRNAGLTNIPTNFREFDFPLNFEIAGYSGPGLGNLINGPDFTYQGSVGLSKIAGKHNLSFGFDYTRLRIFHDSVFSTFQFQNVPTADPQNVANTGHAVASFLLGLPSVAYRIAGEADLDIRQVLYHGYFQDDYRVTPKLTLNLGLRYEYNEWPHHIRGRMGGFDMDAGTFYWTGVNPITGEPPNVRKTIAEPEYTNFAPRIGFAYTILPRTVIRSAYGIFYNSNFGWEWSTGRGNWPYSASDNLTNQNIAGVPKIPAEQYFLSFDASQIKPQAQHTISRDLQMPYMQNWNLGIEHQLTQDLLVELNYQGAKGTHLSSFLSTNDAPPGPGDPNPRRPHPVAGSLSELKMIGTSKYHGLTAKLEKRYSRGLSVLASYAWQKSIDLNSQFGGTSPQDNSNIKASMGPSDFDQTHVFNGGFIWEIPFGNNLTGPARWLVGGWQTTGLVTLESGRVFNVTIPFDNANVGSRGNFQRPNLVGDPFPSGFEQTAGPGGVWFNRDAFVVPSQYTFGNLGRNALRGPSFANVDFGLFKNFRFAEAHRVQFRFEAFNFLNNTNFGNPGGSITTPGFGRITGTASLQRIIQFGAKYNF